MNISQEAIISINAVLEKAYNVGRKSLFEHEVYEVLSYAGLCTPTYDFVTCPEEVDAKLLAKYTGEMMIKIVSEDIAHKQKLGGVEKIMPHDVYFVQYVLEKMSKRVTKLSGNNPKINGFLLVEAVNFSQGIGYELLYGINNDRAFGPTLTLSKGGDDAEFFAKYYDSANVYLPHFSFKESMELVNQLKIRHKLEAIGHYDYIETMARTASIISSLAYEYSPLSKKKNHWHIESMDINPFVFAKDGRFMALDGYATFDKKTNLTIHKANMNGLDNFFTPKSVCVLGVSTRAGHSNMASDIVELLIDSGWDSIYCINPKGGSAIIRGKEFKLYESPEGFDCDLYVYAAPAKNIPLFLKAIAHLEDKGVILIPGLPSDLSFQDFKDQLEPILINSTIRIIGPNCMGVFSSSGEKNVNTLFIEKERLEVQVSTFSNTALLTQSGGMAITLIDRFKNCPIMHSVVSFGNKYDVNITDLVPWFIAHDEIDVIGIYVEGFNELEGRLLYEQACNSTKPIIMYKGGKTDAGAIAASTHTAAMSGDYALVKAMCIQANIILCNNSNSFYNTQKIFSLLSKRNVTGNSFAAVCNAGFEGTLAADEKGELEVVSLSDNTKERLGELDTHGLMGKSTGVIDVTPMTGDILFGDIIQTMIEDENVANIVVGIVPHVDIIKATKENCHDEDSLANIIVRLFNSCKKPIVVSVNGGEVYKEFVKIMEVAGVPVFDNIRDAMKSIESFVNYNIRLNKSE